MVPRYLIFLLPILSSPGFAAAATLEPLGPVSMLSADEAHETCPYGGYCTNSICCDGTKWLLPGFHWHLYVDWHGFNRWHKDHRVLFNRVQMTDIVDWLSILIWLFSSACCTVNKRPSCCPYAYVLNICWWQGDCCWFQVVISHWQVLLINV